MSRTRIAATAIGLVGVLAASQAHAESNSDQEIALLKQQLKMLEQKLDKLQNQTAANTAAAAKTRAEAKAEARSEAKSVVANANAAIPYKGPVAPSGVVVTMPNNRPTICTADEQNCVAITSRVHWDVGGYNYRPDTAATSPQQLDNGENLRRARIGIVGKFFGDWNYALVYDFGGSADGFGGAAAGSLPGGATSGVENAYLSYTGLKPFGGKMAIEAGVMDIAWTMDESTSSNDISSWSVPHPASSRRISQPATSARPSARAGGMTSSGWAPMSPDRPRARSTLHPASLRPAPASNMVRSPASPATRSAATATPCISAPMRNG
jgi:phosphate-selective porin OprO/OprP